MQGSSAGEGHSWGLPALPSALCPGCWWFSLVAAISGGDTLIEPHYFQVCGTLQGHQCRGWGSCVFNYSCEMKERNMSYVKVSITTPYGAVRKLNQSAPFPVERVLFGLEAL